jgi:hypothetical protein
MFRALNLTQIRNSNIGNVEEIVHGNQQNEINVRILQTKFNNIKTMRAKTNQEENSIQ